MYTLLRGTPSSILATVFELVRRTCTMYNDDIEIITINVTNLSEGKMRDIVYKYMLGKRNVSFNDSTSVFTRFSLCTEH